MLKLTPKRGKACKKNDKSGDKITAYKSAYNGSKIKHESIKVKAHELLRRSILGQEWKSSKKKLHGVMGLLSTPSYKS